MIREHEKLLDRCGNVPMYAAKLSVLIELTGYTVTRGMLCAMRRPAPAEPSRFLRDARRVAVLEDITNSTNVGAIFRNAAALSMDAVLLGVESTGLSEKTLRASDHIVKIPMSHGVDSLNVAAASAVAFWELQSRSSSPI